MRNHKPHHYCGILVLLLAVLSVFAWSYFPPAAQRKPVPVIVHTIVKTPGRNTRSQRPDSTERELVARTRKNSQGN